MRDNRFEYEDYYDEYEKGGFIKNPKKHHKPKNKKKGHQSRKSEGEMWADMTQWAALPNWAEEPVEKEKNKNVTTPSKPTQKSATEFIPGPNSHTIKGIIIDYDRVADMSKIEKEFNGKNTYGITFTFKGNRGSTRTIWYNDKLKWRDSDFDKEYVYWVKTREN